MDLVSQFEVHEISTSQDGLQWLSFLFHVDLFRVVPLESNASQMIATQAPHCHMLVATGDEARIVIREELYRENGVVAQVPKGKSAVLLPEEDLQRKHSIHANTDQFFAVVAECQVQNAALVGCFKHHQLL